MNKKRSLGVSEYGPKDISTCNLYKTLLKELPKTVKTFGEAEIETVDDLGKAIAKAVLR